MHNLSDKEFDYQIKGHLDQSEIPYDPSSWYKMNKKLDLAFPATNTGNGSILGIMLFALLLSSVYFWNVSNFEITASNTPEAMVAGSDIAEGTRPTNGSSSLPDKDLTGNATTSSNQTQSPGNVSANQSTDHLQGAEVIEEGINVLPRTETGTALVPNTAASLQSKTGDSFQSDANAGSKPGTGIKVPVNETGTPHTSESLVAKTDETLNSNEEPGIETNQNSDPEGIFGQVFGATSNIGAVGNLSYVVLDPEFSGLGEVPPYIDKPMIQEAELPPVISEPGSPWFIGFGYAPDISLVGFGEATTPGTNLGLALEYQLNHRWSIQTGLTYSMKKYKASGDDYNPPYGFWGYGDVPENTDAECNVIDIPVNIRYYFSAKDKSRFFASTGLSTYLMLTEDYYYHYDGYYDPDLVDSWSVRNENQHPFGIYNLSAGYQRSLGKQWFLEIEPFIKVPLSGVGFGKVDLWSTGAMFSVKCNFK